MTDAVGALRARKRVDRENDDVEAEAVERGIRQQARAVLNRIAGRIREGDPDGAGILAMGGCNLRGPLYRAFGQRGRLNTATGERPAQEFCVSGPPFRTLTIGEMLQALKCYRGEQRIPEDIYDLCQITAEFAPCEANSPLARTSVALIEPNTSIEIAFRGFSINRRGLHQFVAPLNDIGESARKLLHAWFTKGILGVDEVVAGDASRQLIPMLPSDLPDRDLTIEVLRGTTGVRREVTEGLTELVEMLGMPVGVVTFTWSYMPDGRSVSWPADFHAALSRAVEALGLPIFEPHLIVRKAGLKTALKPDLRHYTDAFMTELASPMIEFTRSLSPNGRSSSGPVQTGSAS